MNTVPTGTIDYEGLKALAAGLAAIVSVMGAVIAYRASRRTRADIFAKAQEDLVLVMAENDERARSLSLRATVTRIELQDLVESRGRGMLNKEAELISMLQESLEAERTLSGRKYSAEWIEAQQMSASSLRTLRLLTSGERVLAVKLSGLAFEAVLMEAQKRIDALKTQPPWVPPWKRRRRT